jgi:uncharacterized protein YeaO (DUF488 family)
MTTRNYLPLDHVDLPRAIQSHPASHARELELQHRIIAERSRSSRLSLRIRREMVHYPWMISAIYANTPQVIPQDDLLALLSDPLVRFAIIVEGWNAFGRKYENTLYDDAESVERLVNYLRAKNRAGQLPLTGYLAHLWKDPNRWARVAKEIAPEERARRLDDVRANAVLNQHQSAASAYFVLASTKDAASVDANYCKLMAVEPEYAYLTALLLRARGAQAEAWQKVIAGVESPRWSFHIIRAQLAPGPKGQHLRDNLTSNPQWLVELFAHKCVEFDDMTKLYQECVAKCQGHEMLSDMHNWVRTMSHLFVPDSMVSQAGHLGAS